MVAAPSPARRRREVATIADERSDMLYRALVAALLFVTADGSRLPGSGSITLTSEMKLDDQGMRASILPFSASWSAPIKKIGQLTLMGDTSKGKESFAREVRLNGVAAKTSAGTLSYDISRRLRSGFAPPHSERAHPPCPASPSAAAPHRAQAPTCCASAARPLTTPTPPPGRRRTS